MSMYAGWDPPRPGWVCPECALDYDATPPDAVGRLLAPLVPEYGIRLRRDAELLRRHPDPTSWSALEYACHVRDCFALYHWRIGKALAEDRPQLPQMRRDDVVVERAYNRQDPATVRRELGTGHERLSALLAEVDGAQWQRVAVREGEDLTVAWMAVNSLHEARHHLVDIDRVLERPGSGRELGRG